MQEQVDLAKYFFLNWLIHFLNRRRNGTTVGKIDHCHKDSLFLRLILVTSEYVFSYQYEEPNGAKYLCKKNTFNDFVDVAKWLIEVRICIQCLTT